MRELREPSRLRFALRRRATAWLAVASFFGLVLTQPFHASTPAATAGAASATQAVAAGDLPAHHAAHDPGLCALCRAAAQTRFDLRPPAPAIAVDGSSLPLHLPAPVSPGSAPELRSARPRAPPAPSAALPS
jgi:hypothetical protein